MTGTAISTRNSTFAVGDVVFVDLELVRLESDPKDLPAGISEKKLKAVRAAVVVLRGIPSKFRAAFLRRNVGSEQQKRRRCLVVYVASPLNNYLVLPISDDERGRKNVFPKFVPVPSKELDAAGLEKASSICCEQLQCVSHERLSDRTGSITPVLLYQVRRCLATMFLIGSEHLDDEADTEDIDDTDFLESTVFEVAPKKK